jgi:hypothetical protein
MSTKDLIRDLTSANCLRNIIRASVETYPFDWIVIHEALQNALDAIQRSDKEKGRVEVDMDLDNELIQVYDNGLGFPCKLELLGFGGSDKDPEDLKLGGEIGVGIKVVILSSETFELESVYNEDGVSKQWKCKVSDGNKYLKGKKDRVEVSHVAPSISKAAETYTIIRYKFPSEERSLSHFIGTIYDNYIESGLIHDDLAKSITEKFKLALEHYFRTTGYSANVNNVIGVETTKETNINVRVFCKDPSFLDKKLRPIFTKNPKVEVSFKNRYWDAEEAILRTKPRPGILTLPPFPPGGDIGSRSADYVYVQKFQNWSQFKNLVSMLRGRKADDIDYYEKIFNKWVLGAYLVVGSRDNLRKYLIGIPRLHAMAASGILSVHDLTVLGPIGGLGFINNIHFVISTKAKPSYGKQAIKKPWLIRNLCDLFTECFRRSLRKTAECIVGKAPESPAPPFGPVMEVVNRPDMGITWLGIRKEPKEEVEVIALFSELLGNGTLKNYEIWQLSTREAFDGKMLLPLKGQTSPPPHTDSDLHDVEFKVWLSDLISDFDENIKNPIGLKLAVVWEDDFDQKYPKGHERYQIVDIAHTTREDWESWSEFRPPPVKKAIHDRDTGGIIYLLELKDVVGGLKKTAT